MSEQKITIEFILSTLQGYIENKDPISPVLWLDSAQKLNVLLGDETDSLFDLQQRVAQIKLSYLVAQEKRNVSEANLRTEASDEYRDMCKKKARIEQIEEFIRLAKHQATMRSNEMRGY